MSASKTRDPKDDSKDLPPKKPTRKKPKPSWFTTPVADFMKWLVGTLALGIATALSTWIYQHEELAIRKTEGEQELRIKQLEADSKLIEAISERFDSSANSKRTALDYYNFIRPFITSADIQNALELQIGKFSEVTKISEEKSKAISDSINKIAIKYQYVSVVPLPDKQLDVSKIDEQEQKQLDAQGISQKTIDSLLGVTKKLSSLQLNEVNKAKENIPFINKGPANAMIDSPSQQWFKEGYYREFNQELRVGLNKLDADQQIIHVRISDTEGKVIEGCENVRISLGKSYTITHSGVQYVIDFDYIGAAGKNPFTKAAYITVTAYKVQPVAD